MEEQTVNGNGRAVAETLLSKPEDKIGIPAAGVSPDGATVAWAPNREPVNKNVYLEQTTYFDQHAYDVYSTETGELIGTHVSATTVLGAIAKPWLTRWYGELGWREASRKMREAQDNGSAVHHAIEMLVTGGAVVFHPHRSKRRVLTDIQVDEIAAQHHNRIAILEDQDLQIQVGRFSQFMAVTGAKVHYAECMVWSPTLKCAGTVDLVLEIPGGKYPIAGSKPVELPGGLYIADIKTGAESEDHALQIAAYKYMFEEMTGQAIAGGLIIHTNATQIKGGIEGFKAVHYDLDELATALTQFRNVHQVWTDRNPGWAPKVKSFPVVITMNRALKDAYAA